MFAKHRRALWVGILIVAFASAASLIIGRPRISFDWLRRAPVTPLAASQKTDKKKDKSAPRRNLSLQPEAYGLSRRLGQRFSSRKSHQSVLVGVLTVGSERRTVQTTRVQTDDGEEVDIRIAGSSGVLTWDRSHGALSSKARPSAVDRDLIERLVFDSPDQFVLAQLRGASYYTIARNVRPPDAGDNYSGPLWNIVRVNDPEEDEAKRPQSRWRLYYLNTTTGLIDKIETEVQGQKILVVFSWTTVNGEMVPAQITWTSNGTTVMQYQLTNFASAEKEGGRQ